MEKFNRVIRGYDPIEVNSFIDNMIGKFENLVNTVKERDLTIKELEEELTNIKKDQEHYKGMEETLNRTLLLAQKTSDQMRSNAMQEGALLVDDAKKNASRIINDALTKAEKIELDSMRMKRNTHIFKRRLKDIIDAQLEVIEEIDTIDL